MQKQNTSAADPGGKPARSGRRTLVLIVLLFLAPVVLATSLYLSGWRPDGKGLQQGELVQPARPLTNTNLRKTDSTEYRLHALRGSWTFITFSRLPCNDICQNNLYKMQQVRLAQGKDAGRVQRAFIALDGSNGLRTLETKYPGLTVFTGAPAAVQTLAREFTSSHGTPLDGLERVYLVDPNGNLLMSYAPDADPSGMRKDLARLLRLSQIG